MPDASPRIRLSRDQRRLQLLDVAWRIIGRDGADALTLGRVAKQAGVTKPIVYDHFKDREGLLMALYRDFDVRQTEVLDTALASGSPQPKARAGIIADAYVDCVLAQGREMPSILGALAGSRVLEQVKCDYQHAFIAKCRALLTPKAQGGPATDARFWAMLGAADGLANAAANGQIEATVAKAQLREIILTVILRS